MPLTINTQGAGYQNLLSSMLTIRNQLQNNYGPILKKMSRAQLKDLYQRDPLFKECVDLARDLSRLAEKVGVDL